MSNAEMFEYQGKEYHASPTLRQLFEDAGMSKAHIPKYVKKLNGLGFDEFVDLVGITKAELMDAKFSPGAVKTLFEHIQVVKNLGGIVLDYDGVRSRESDFRYVSTGSTMLDEMMTYADGNVGLRSSTMTEMYGEAGSGKSQICMTVAAIAMKSKEEGGMGAGVIYIDSEGAFEASRFDYLARYWGVDEEFLRNNLYYSRVTNFDEVEMALSQATTETADLDIGIIIIDSIMDPLKNQYVIGGKNLTNLQPRQQHLTNVLSDLKKLAISKNAIAMYTNHIMSDIGAMGHGPKIAPAGGHAMSHASDIRLYLSRAPVAESSWFGSTGPKRKINENMALHPGRAKIVDSGFLPKATGYYMLGPMGVCDPRQIKKIQAQAELIQEKGYLCIDSHGETIDPIYETMSRDERINKITMDLYGPEGAEAKNQASKRPSRKSKKVEEEIST